MTKRDDDLALGIVPQHTLNAWPVSTKPTFQSGGSTRELTRMGDEFCRQVAIIEAESLKEKFGQDKVAEIAVHTMANFERTSGAILAIKNLPRDKEHQMYCEAFAKILIPTVAQNLLSVSEAGISNIRHEVSRTLDLPPEPPPPPPPPRKRSLRQVLFG